MPKVQKANAVIIPTWVGEFREAWNFGCAGFMEAGKILVAQLDKDRSAAMAEIGRLGLTNQVVRRLERLGRGLLDERLLTACDGTAKCLETLPIATQKEALDNGIKVVVNGGQHLVIKPENMTRDQARQVFAYDHIRTEAEQRAWLETQKTIATRAKELTQATASPFEVVGSRLVINKPQTFTRLQLLEILASMG